ncbi:MAG: hypothetical protein R3Y52_01920 [Psittacicella sp.]
MNIYYDENKYLKKFFNSISFDYKNLIYKDIENRLPKLIKLANPKIKTADKFKFNGSRFFFECKIILDKNIACRVAYIYSKTFIKIIYISFTLVKRLF